jgi:hypothetical protein
MFLKQLMQRIFKEEYRPTYLESTIDECGDDDLRAASLWCFRTGHARVTIDSLE